MYDIIIIGAGPAGLTAGIYSTRARLKVLVIDKMGFGGNMAKTYSVENYPGFKSISGYDLAEKMYEQFQEFGGEIVFQTVKDIEVNDIKKVICVDDRTFDCKSVIISTGSATRYLGCKGEQEFFGKGVSYCGTCDGAFFKDKHVVCVGGGDTALDEANFLTRFAKKVTIVHRGHTFTAEKILVERITNNAKIEIIWDSEIKEIKGDKTVKGISLYDKKDKTQREYSCDGVFIFIGYVPETKFAKNAVKLNEAGYIVTDELMNAGNGIFACGDCRANAFKQIVVAPGEGALASHSAEKYLQSKQ